MIRIIVLLLIIAGPVPLPAQDAIEEPRQGAGDAETSQPTGPAGTWPQPFLPSEEIGADSQVSFPTDI